MTDEEALPSNPYKRSPIRDRKDLASRQKEQKQINYYLKLTASGQSPHLALIGQRGVGKTSLLNAADSIAVDLKLLPVRLDMNENKAQSPGKFWQDLYLNLVLSMAKLGCWDGLNGSIYAELLQMLYARKTGSIEKAVLQIPYALAHHNGQIETFDCADGLVRHDFAACLVELKRKDINGLVFLIDEADCLGQNMALLQMIRNIFQSLEGCSLILAGTEAVFPAISLVFSPIPRQFYRIEVQPFTSWSETMELVLKPMQQDLAKKIAPEFDILQDLHELCGGAPDEVQLYCHHMYRNIEDGGAKRMVLSPQVFRNVLNEYRANTSSDIGGVLNAIERLPDKLLFESKWLSRRKLDIKENIYISLLQRDLKEDSPASDTEKQIISNELENGYKTLRELGITESESQIRLAGSPLSAGFWKSYVEAERNKRWRWNDDSFSEIIKETILGAIANYVGAIGAIDADDTLGVVKSLRAIRERNRAMKFDEGMGELIAASLVARRTHSTHISSIVLCIESPAGKRSINVWFIEKPEKTLTDTIFQDCVSNRSKLLSEHNISISISDFDRWQIPNTDEMSRLARISGNTLPTSFGPSQFAQALNKFREGDVQGCAKKFTEMLEDMEEHDVRNNLAFCQLLNGQANTALENSSKAIEGKYEPLYELNKAVSQFLLGNKDDAVASLRHALQQISDSKNGFDASSATHVLLLKSHESLVESHEDLPIDAAILINLYRLGGLSQTDFELEMTSRYPEEIKIWKDHLPT